MNRSPETTRDIDKRAELGEDFDFFDTDHDGRMQFDEFANFLSGIESGMSQDDAASASTKSTATTTA